MRDVAGHGIWHRETETSEDVKTINDESSANLGVVDKEAGSHGFLSGKCFA